MDVTMKLLGPGKQFSFQSILKISNETVDFVWSDNEFQTLGAENLKAGSAALIEQNGICSKHFVLERSERSDDFFISQLERYGGLPVFNAR